MIDQPTTAFKEKQMILIHVKLISIYISSQDLHNFQINIYFQL